MKIMSIIAACAFLCGGCLYERNEDGTNKQVSYANISVRTVRGHDYVIATVSGGISVVHAASCPCMSGSVDGEREVRDGQ